MSSISTTETVQQPGAINPNLATGDKTEGNAVTDIDIDEFLQLMITELQNQDPLDPTDNSEIVQQMSHIREIGATDELSNTLESVLSGSNMTTASSLIGKEIEALTDDFDSVSGTVQSASVEIDAEDGNKRLFRLSVLDSEGLSHSVKLDNVRKIVQPVES
ncbi:MAG: flagellar biosynthesis protein FlgD [Pirellulaceae bacterium]|nr:flagellar biosynthesis protein FlgD [Pirellulaceae bacterium]